MSDGSEAEGAAPAPRAWCRICRARLPLRRIYWWPCMEAHFGECERCGNTLRAGSRSRGRQDVLDDPPSDETGSAAQTA